ncbi:MULTISPECIES: AAA family ATPase [Emticicia]|uniref:AAA family ATPase n=1 Tax=Emticicia TaxID=312278 RepID=UPI00209DFFF6|nr:MULTISPECIES: AAA family ATPase [Emticicia]UTA66720.1 AAA family ATPase [Emticicia sp. 21SJ11W-3]
MQIQSFKVFQLHGTANYNIDFVDNYLILVAENGSGKTTLVNIFYYFLSRQWKKLNEFKFEKIELKIDDTIYTYEMKWKNIALREAKIFKRFPGQYQIIAEKILREYSISEIAEPHEFIDYIMSEYDIPRSIAYEIARMLRNEEISIDSSSDLKKIDEALNEIFKNIQIVYLPTYRRIEKDLKNIFPELEGNMKEYELRRRLRSRGDKTPSFIELVEFGMEDVKERIQNRCQELRHHFYNNLSRKITGSYLEDILNKRYKSFDSEKIQIFNREALDYLLNRLDDSIISKSGKEALNGFVEMVQKKGAISDEDKINAYFVWKLFQIYEEQQKAELDINKFVDICNDYIGSSKRFFYDNDNFKVDIQLSDSFSSIEYKDLSSGEKQIVSLFSHLILSKQKYFVIIDEPELSLSVPWQERFLQDIVNTEDCAGILAVTHSPFIFRNFLKSYSHSLEEFKFN